MRAVDLALHTGRKLQSSQTGLVHYCYEEKDGVHLTIPTLENALFALALFRSRQSENILEGKSIIKRLLAFEENGNFPVYLHDYPDKKDPYLGMRILPVLFWLLRDFSHVIGSLKKELALVCNRIIDHASNCNLPRWAAFRLLAYEGKIQDLPNGYIEWGEAFISLQMAEAKGASIQESIRNGAKFWHPKLQLYIGPTPMRHQEGYAPEFTLFDLFMCQWQKVFPKRGEEIRPIHLRGSLVRPLGFELPIIEKPVPYIHFDAEEMNPLFIAWDVHTLTLAKKRLQVAGNAREITITYPDELPDTEDKSFELNFYLNHHCDHRLLVNGQKASCFSLGDEVQILSRGVMIQLIFLADEGKYFGHFMRGNRPSQHALQGENQFSAYDWRIAIRTVSRRARAIIRVLVHVQELESPQPLPLHASHCPHKE